MNQQRPQLPSPQKPGSRPTTLSRGGMPGPITAPGMKPPTGPPTGPPGAGGKPNPWKPGPKPPGFGMPKPKDPFKDRKWKYGYQAALFGDGSVDPRTHKNWRAKMPRWMRKAVQKGGADWRSHLNDAGRGHAKRSMNRIKENYYRNQRRRAGIRPRPPQPGMRPGMRPPIPRPGRRPPRGGYRQRPRGRRGRYGGFDRTMRRGGF